MRCGRRRRRGPGRMTARPLDVFAACLTLGLCIVWGFNQVVVKLALADVGPVAQTGIRSAIGVLCVVAYAMVTKRRVFVLDGTEAAGVLAGFLFTAEFIALFKSLRWTTASRATVFIYAAPFFVALGAVFLLKDERLRPVQWIGLALAFVGVALAMVGRTPGGGLSAMRWRSSPPRSGARPPWSSRRRRSGAPTPSRCCSTKSQWRRLSRRWPPGRSANPRRAMSRPVTARRAPLAGDRGRRGQLFAMVLGSQALRRAAAFRLHLHFAAGRRLRRLAGVRR